MLPLPPVADGCTETRLRYQPPGRTVDSSSINAVSFSSARHNEPLSAVAMRISNPDRSAVTIQRQKPQRTLIAWRCCNGRPKSETANPNRGTTPPHSCYV